MAVTGQLVKFLGVILGLLEGTGHGFYLMEGLPGWDWEDPVLCALAHPCSSAAADPTSSGWDQQREVSQSGRAG